MRFDLVNGKLVEGDSDRAEACAAGRLGKIDGDIDRWKKQQAREERAARKEEATRTRCLRVEARLLLARGLAEAIYRRQRTITNPLPVSVIERRLKSEAWYNPETIIILAIQIGASL